MGFPFAPSFPAASSASSVGSTIVPGASHPGYTSGMYVWPQWAITNAGVTLTTTISRLYYLPIYIGTAVTVAGASVYNSGAGDNGEVLRIGIYTNVNGRPSALVKDFGEITLTGASAERTALSSTALTAGWYWMAVHHNTACAMFGFRDSQTASAAGYVGPFLYHTYHDFGSFTTPIGLTGGEPVTLPYVDTAYGALAANAVAPTAQTAVVPAMWLKV